MLRDTSLQGDGLELGSARAGTGTRLLGEGLAWEKQVLNSDEFAQGTAACTWGLRAYCGIPVTRGDGLELGSARAGSGTRLLGEGLARGKQVLNSDEFAQGTLTRSPTGPATIGKDGDRQ